MHALRDENRRPGSRDDVSRAGAFAMNPQQLAKWIEQLAEEAQSRQDAKAWRTFGTRFEGMSGFQIILQSVDLDTKARLQWLLKGPAERPLAKPLMGASGIWVRKKLDLIHLGWYSKLWRPQSWVVIMINNSK